MAREPAHARSFQGPMAPASGTRKAEGAGEDVASNPPLSTPAGSDRSLREAGDRVRLVWMGNTVEAVVVTVKTKGRTTRYQVQIDGVRGHPWYEESELTSV